MNYVIFRKFLTNHDCQFLTSVISHIPAESKDLGLVDGEKSDIWHKSIRNKGMDYFYSTNESVIKHLSNIKTELTACTGIEFTDELSSKSAVFCRYSYNGVSNPHRDRDKTTDNTFQKYTALILLTSNAAQSPADIDDRNRDEFFINFGEDYILENIGREVKREVNDRFYPNLNKGDVIIFRNDISIHGVDPVKSSLQRITTVFRSK